MSTKRVIALVIGCVMALPAIGMLFGGGALALAYATQRDDGYFDVTVDRLQTPTVAITGEDVRFTTDPGSPDWLIDTLDLDIRLRATALDDAQAIFIGIARQDDLDRYLADLAHDRVVRIDDGAPVYQQQGRIAGPIDAPADQDFWVARAVGPGTQELTWSATSGRWAAVVMNADGSPGISVTMAVGATSGLILPVAVVLAVAGFVLTAVAVVLIVYGASGARRREDDEGAAMTGTAEPVGSPLPPPTGFDRPCDRAERTSDVRGHAMTGSTIAIDHLTKRYGDTTVLDDLSFVVEPGRVTGFLGPNGAGKSTTMKILLDLASADDGTATIGGCRYRDLADPARTVGVVIEADAFHPGRSGRNHLRVVADTAGIDHERVDEMIDAVGLTSASNRRVGAYSLGMRQRLGLAAALLGDPPVLILDEPANGLDPQGVRTLRDLLRARAAAGGTVLVSSHLLAEVEHLADDIVIIAAGRLVRSAPLGELQHATSLVRTPDATRLSDVLASGGATVRSDEPDTLLVHGLTTDQIGDLAFGAGIVLHELTARANSLEELFLQSTTPAASDDSGHTAPIEPTEVEHS
jgi:ABC-2 type transport system ATP-binding protein